MTAAEPDPAEIGDLTALDRSQDAIQEAKDAVPAALTDTQPGEGLDVPGVGEGLESDQEDVVPRPN